MIENLTTWFCIGGFLFFGFALLVLWSALAVSGRCSDDEREKESSC